MLLPAAIWALDLTVGAGAAQNCPASAVGIGFSGGAIAYLEPAPVVTFDDYGGGRYSPNRGNDIGIGIAYGEVTGESRRLLRRCSVPCGVPGRGFTRCP